MLKPLIKRFDTHRPHAPCDKLSDWIFHHRGGNARFQAKAIRQIRSHIEFSATDMDVARVRLPKRHYAWIKSMHHRSQCQEVPPAGGRDFLALGAMVHRLDPGVVPFRKANACHIHVSGGEFNVAANLADCFGLKTGIATAMVEYPIGELIAGCVRAMGVEPFYKWFKHDGVLGPNMATV